MRYRSSLLAALLALSLPTLGMSQSSTEDSTNVAPPDLPLYDQPTQPADGYLWAPGYWAWSDDAQDYYWVPGTWVLAPQPEFCWTPGYWEIVEVVFVWHPGYWGRHLGFYGGINYGFGYRGNGTGNRSSYNGGNGIQARPTAAQLAAAGERHIDATAAQRQQVEWARTRLSLHVNQNQGRPPIAATPRAGEWNGAGVVGAKPVSSASAHQAGSAAGNSQPPPGVTQGLPPRVSQAPPPSAVSRVTAPRAEQARGDAVTGAAPRTNPEPRNTDASRPSWETRRPEAPPPRVQAEEPQRSAAPSQPHPAPREVHETPANSERPPEH